ERPEKPDRIASTADTRDEKIRQAFLTFEDLPACFVTDHSVEVPYHHRIGMRAESRAENVMGRADVGHPVTHCLIDGLLEGRLACSTSHDLCPEEAHAGNIERLALHIDRSHVDHASESRPRAHCSCRYTVLACTGFCDDALLTHSLGE